MIIAIIISVLLFSPLIALCDDKKEVWAVLKNNKAELTLWFIPLIIYIAIPMAIYINMNNDPLWNPMNFCGMPSYALPRSGATHYAWWNLVYILVDTTKRIVFYFPAGAILLGTMVWVNLKYFNPVRYISLISIEFMVLLVTFSMSY